MNLFLFIPFVTLWKALAYPMNSWSDSDTLSSIGEDQVARDLETENRRQEAVTKLQELKQQHHSSHSYFKDVDFDSELQSPESEPIAIEQHRPDGVPLQYEMRHEPDTSPVHPRCCAGLHAPMSGCKGITPYEAIDLGLSCCRLPCAALLGCTVSSYKCACCSMRTACCCCCFGQDWEKCKEKGICGHLQQTICRPGLNCFRWAARTDRIKETISKMKSNEGNQ